METTTQINKYSPARTLWILFFSFFKISAVTFGGGFVIATFVKKKMVDELGWITEEEMLDMIALGQSSPGAIAVNIAILVGWKMQGLAGMIVATLGTIIPPMVILSVISAFYTLFSSSPLVAAFLKGMQAGVAALLLDVVLGLGGKIVQQKSPVRTILMAVAFLAVLVFKISVITILAVTLILSVFLVLLNLKGGKKV